MSILPEARIPEALTFQEPTTTHPKDSSGQSIADVARSLEKRYKLVHQFVSMHRKDISGVIIDEYRMALKYGTRQAPMNATIGESIKDMWRKFLLREEHGIKTGTAQSQNRQSFIDTGSYMGGMRVKVK